MAVLYRYECEATGETRDEFYTPGEAPNTLFLDGKTWCRYFGNRQKWGDRGQYSSAMGVHPSQIAEATKQSYADGYGTHFDPEGRMFVKDNDHRNRAMKALGLRDKDACYNQHAGD